jgi:hypothetical protein
VHQCQHHHSGNTAEVANKLHAEGFTRKDKYRIYKGYNADLQIKYGTKNQYDSTLYSSRSPEQYNRKRGHHPTRDGLSSTTIGPQFTTSPQADSRPKPPTSGEPVRPRARGSSGNRRPRRGLKGRYKGGAQSCPKQQGVIDGITERTPREFVEQRKAQTTRTLSLEWPPNGGIPRPRMLTSKELPRRCPGKANAALTETLRKHEETLPNKCLNMGDQGSGSPQPFRPIKRDFGNCNHKCEGTSLSR